MTWFLCWVLCHCYFSGNITRAAVGTGCVICWECDVRDSQGSEELDNSILLKLLTLFAKKGTAIAYNDHEGEANRAA